MIIGYRVEAKRVVRSWSSVITVNEADVSCLEHGFFSAIERKTAR